MKPLIVTIGIALCASCAFAEVINTCKNLTKEQIAQRRERLIKVNGPLVTQPDSQHGRIGVVNSVAEFKNLDLALGLVMFRNRMSPYRIDVIQSETPAKVETAKAMREAAKLEFAVFVVSCDGLPAFMTAPEDCWAIVNAKVCKTPDRTVKMVAKAFAHIAGAATGAGLSFLSTTKPEELDMVKFVDFPFDVQQRIDAHLKLYNVTPERRATYRVACQEGWAPAPTNDIQKAIWEKIHAAPTKPLKITYDKDKQKPVVK